MSDSNDNEIYGRIAAILTEARRSVARTINVAMVQAYWHVGREIVQEEQQGEHRAEYGTALMKRLSERLTKEFGAGFGISNLKEIRRFFVTFPNGSGIGRTLSGLSAIGQTPSGLSAAIPFPQSLSWSHYVTLMRVTNENARSFYEVEAVREAW
ncbi:MAG: DUF1016 N-terminal domain-containing protein, partial [Proteobacteria bacterium]|nr:DUF1016 N-terminal domain-containing protein [Pseudomonadota bacterium]